jgi:hypothetical protein
MKWLLIFIILLLSQITDINAQTSVEIGEIEQEEQIVPISLGIIIYSNDSETVWNALRLANFSKSEGDTVSVFLLGKGVELEVLAKKNEDVKDQVGEFLDGGGSILGCGTCLRTRNYDTPEFCKFSSMFDLYKIIHKNKRVLTF